MADQELIKNLRTLNKMLARQVQVDILTTFFKAGIVDNSEYRDEMKKIAELNGFKTDQAFWTRDLY